MDSENALYEIDSAMEDCIFVTLIQAQDCENQTGNVDIILLDAEKIRAAFTADPDGAIDNHFRSENGRVVIDGNVKSSPNGSEYHGVSVSKQIVKNNGRNLFGTEEKWDEMRTKEKGHIYDVVKYTDASGVYPLLLDKEIEVEIDMESHKYRIREIGDGYISGEVFCWGYWGKLLKNPGFSNYVVTYEMKPNDKSVYGFVISSMRIEEIKLNNGKL